MSGIARIALYGLIGILAIDPLLRCRPEELMTFVVLAAVAPIAALCRWKGYQALLGAAVALCPFLGPSVLILCALLLVARAPSALTHQQSAWALPAVALLGGAALYQLALTALPWGLSIDSPGRAVDVLRSLLEVRVSTWAQLERLVLFTLLLSLFAGDAGVRNRFAAGLVVGGTVAALLAVLYSAGLTSVALRSQSEFWTGINRVSSTLSDPNALGVVLALILWIVALLAPSWLHRPRVFLPWGLLVLLAGLLSGSRTFLLSAALLVIAWAYQRSRRLTLTAALAASFAAVAVNVLSLASPATLDALLGLPMPEGLRRTMSTVVVATWQDSLFSRAVFTRLSTLLVQESPLFGVGAGRYRDYVALFSAQHGLGLGAWVDNANNFYLGVLAELGAVGMAALLLALSGRRISRGATSLAGPAVASLALVLLTGPHLEFTEVLVVSALLLGAATEPRALRPELRNLSALVLFVLGALGASTQEQGIYRWKLNSHQAYRLLASDAILHIPCAGASGQRSAPLSFRALYVPQSAPLSVRASAPEGSATLSISDTVEHTVSLPCEPGAESASVKVSVRPPWSPYRAWPERSRDRRILGVEQLLEIRQQQPLSGP